MKGRMGNMIDKLELQIAKYLVVLGLFSFPKDVLQLIILILQAKLEKKITYEV